MTHPDSPKVSADLSNCRCDCDLPICSIQKWAVRVDFDLPQGCEECGHEVECHGNWKPSIGDYFKCEKQV